MNYNIKIKLLLKSKKYKECILEFQKIINNLILNYLKKYNIKYENNLNLSQSFDTLAFNFPKLKGFCEYGKNIILQEDNSPLQMLEEYSDLYNILKSKLT